MAVAEATEVAVAEAAAEVGKRQTRRVAGAGSEARRPCGCTFRSAASWVSLVRVRVRVRVRIRVRVRVRVRVAFARRRARTPPCRGPAEAPPRSRVVVAAETPPRPAAAAAPVWQQQPRGLGPTAYERERSKARQHQRSSSGQPPASASLGG